MTDRSQKTTASLQQNSYELQRPVTYGGTHLRTKWKLVLAAFAAVISGTRVFSVIRQGVLEQTHARGVTPEDLISSKLSPALRGLIEDADPHQSISVWVEFDPSVSEIETGTSFI